MMESLRRNVRISWTKVYERTGEGRTEQDRTGQDRTGQDRTGQDRTGQDRTVLLTSHGSDRSHNTAVPTPSLQRDQVTYSMTHTPSSMLSSNSAPFL
jgi:hypothetical protein